MELLWEAPHPLTVADVHARLTTERELAYTTVMTVLDRLSKKSMVRRELAGRAWQYSPVSTQAEAIATEMASLLTGVSGETRLAALRVFSRYLAEAERAALGASGEVVASTGFP